MEILILFIQNFSNAIMNIVQLYDFLEFRNYYSHSGSNQLAALSISFSLAYLNHLKGSLSNQTFIKRDAKSIL